MVPQIRKSSYLSLLTDALPSLRDASPGNIQEEQLPELKHIVAVDNLSDFKKFQEIQQNVKCVADFREVLIWGEDSRESRAVEEMTRSLHKDDIMNMQFTR